MNVIFYTILAAVTVVGQINIVPQVLPNQHLYDLFVPLVVYAGLHRSPTEGLGVAFFIGLLMDSLSAGPVGVYTTGYVWIFILIRFCTRYFQPGNPIIGGGLVVGAVVLQNLLSFLVVWAKLSATVSMAPLLTAWEQAIWGIATGPIIYLGIGFMHRKWIESWLERFGSLDMR